MTEQFTTAYQIYKENYVNSQHAPGGSIFTSDARMQISDFSASYQRKPKTYQL